MAVWSMEPVVRRLEPQCEYGFFPAAGEWGTGRMWEPGTVSTWEWPEKKAAVERF